MQLSQFQESLLVISAMKTSMENDLRIIKRYMRDDDVKFALSNKMLIDICSFLDEWERFNTYVKGNERVMESMKITAPAIKRLKRWSGLKAMRNTMLAHGHRDDRREGRLTSLDERYFNADVPTTYAEIMLLSEFCVYVISAFLCRHREDHQQALCSIPKRDANVVRGIETLGEFEAAVSELQEHMFALDPGLKRCLGLEA